MSYPRVINGDEWETFQTSTVEDRSKVGQKMVIEDGRIFRFCQANSSAALVAADLNQAEIPIIADYSGQAVGTMATNVTVLTGVGVTNNNVAIDALVNGYCWTETAAQLGSIHRIKSNTLITAGAATGTITLYNPTNDAIAAAETISYVKNPWSGVLQCPAPLTAQPAGVSPIALAVNSYGWLATGGPARVLTIGTLVAGDLCVSSATTAGGVMPSAALETDGPQVGWVMLLEATTTMSAVFLTLE